jgi:hypothetical protein
MAETGAATASDRNATVAGRAGGAFDFWRGLFDGLGWTDAADNLDRYLGGSGAEKVYDERQIEKMPPVTYRIGKNNTRFESKTFTGRTKKAGVREKLMSLRPGQSTDFEDDWDATYSPQNILSNAAEGTYSLLTGDGASKLKRAYDDLTDTVAYPGTYAAIGSFPVKSRGRFRAERNGDRLTIRGTVDHDLSDRFDFDPGQPGDAPGRALEDAGRAAEFPFRYRSRQDVEAEGEYGPGGITIRRTTWGKRR